MSAPRRPVVLMILDGFGTNPAGLNNAVVEASTPCLDDYFSRYPHTLLQASGPAVGLPDGQMGNSEVGHLTIGCGDIVRQDLVYIDDAINNGYFFNNPVLLAAVEQAKSAGRPLHLMGLVSDGGVHSHIRHLKALIELCRRHQVVPLVHMFCDGRDTSPQSAHRYVNELEDALQNSDGAIATISGRYYAMDRDNRWERTALAWQAIVQGRGEQGESASAVIEQAYAKGINDEFILPTALPAAQSVSSDDHVILFNYRKDRVRQLTRALFKPDFDAFDRGQYHPPKVSCMTEYDEWYKLPFAFEQEHPKQTLGGVVSRADLQQFHCAETEKYAHVTYFLNGGRGDAFNGEEREIIPSPDVATYDLAPEMNAKKVADAVIEAMQRKRYALIVVNFANGDMVGHTGKRKAILKAVEAMDQQVGRVLNTAESESYSVLLTADHGNCEEMVDPITGEPHTQHTLYPVPCLILDKHPWQLSCVGGLSSVAPTVLHLMGLPIPEQMTGRSLLLKPIM
ncbi:MAG: 2,3-bisphosphoglycerate-independent phosphoglycerate mutase [Gammaproteobacteria bacterium]|nr:2,3-bisphosphoglycerate-independent phosphoglycerate mutase [Gammaproteobacteria bacterium]